MRINVYAEELTTETELVTKTVTDGVFGTRTFYGIRVYMHSAPVLHDDPEDDDRTAITFWVPWTREGGHDFPTLRRALQAMNLRVEEAMALEDLADEMTQRMGQVQRSVNEVVAETVNN
jgi:hypothetical protein